MRNSGIFWGVVLLVAGTLLLLDSLNIIQVSAWMILGPLFVIALGVWILWGAVSKSSRTEVNLNLPIENAASARIKISHAAGKLKLKAGTDADTFMQGLFRGGVDQKIQRNGDVIDLSLKMPASDFNLNWAPGDSFDWSINMTKDIPLSFEVETGAAEVSFDLTELQVNNLLYKSGASSSEIYFPAHAKMTTSRIEAGAAAVKIFIPQGVSARILAQGGLSAIDADTNRFIRSGKGFISADWATASDKVEIEVNVGVGSVTIR